LPDHARIAHRTDHLRLQEAPSPAGRPTDPGILLVWPSRSLLWLLGL